MLRVPGFQRQISRREALLALGLTAVAGRTGWSAEVAVPTDVDRIEEDWYLQVGEPDPDNDSPQILSVISPFATTDGPHAIFEINHCTQPDYFGGGMQLQRWAGQEQCRAMTRTINSGVLSIPSEVVTYTARMALSGGKLTYSIENGSSQTWGAFGGNVPYSLSVSTELTSLSGYKPAFSVSESKVAYGSHRVKMFKIKKIRYYRLGSVIAEDSTERVVHQYDASSSDAAIPVTAETP